MGIIIYTRTNVWKRVIYMGFLRWLVGIIIIFWLLGFILNIGGGMIHILLVIAVIIFIYDLVMGGRR